MFSHQPALIAVAGTYKNSTVHNNCTWDTETKLTLTEVSGTGTCIGNPPSNLRSLCNTTTQVSLSKGYLVPNTRYWLSCNTGLTLCVSLAVFDSNSDYCVLIYLMPRVYYHHDDEFVNEFDHAPEHHFRREPIIITLAVLLGIGGIAAGISTGTSALVNAQQQYHELKTAIDEDLRAIESSITRLKESLTSLSEVTLQNRSGLDLLFLKDGGLCATLKEECCFYIDHSGIIEDSMQKLRERLDKRKRDQESQETWFESLFYKSPWLTTLVSTLIGPLILLFILLLFGPCIINKFVTFVKDHISTVQLIVLRQQYQNMREPDCNDTASRDSWFYD
ncbi:PREDICTED: MLV-related proviral Env polyprotein-like [Elephantulus edwardii]|uniref:MLV-related proviral Env polyprotein-like n=1 Tax=Elephantulus edwardii TaxID=28737 RepID=UPI0003F0A940|nr:PREDICTED: MLV-related proviral Env polyprotein-like [Elephantulus edwardii]